MEVNYLWPPWLSESYHPRYADGRTKDADVPDMCAASFKASFSAWRPCLLFFCAGLHGGLCERRCDEVRPSGRYEIAEDDFLLAPGDRVASRLDGQYSEQVREHTGGS